MLLDLYIFDIFPRVNRGLGMESGLHLTGFTSKGTELLLNFSFNRALVGTELLLNFSFNRALVLQGSQHIA